LPPLHQLQLKSNTGVNSLNATSFSNLGSGGATPSRNVAQLLEKLSDSDSKVRLEATKALGQLAKRSDAAVTAALLGCLADKNNLVRKYAMESLVQVAERGDAEIVAGLIRLLRHGSWFVRQAVASALGRIASRGDGQSVEALVSVLVDEREEVVQAALDSLGKLGRQGDVVLVDALLEQLRRSDSWRAKCSASQALAQVADRGVPQVTSALLENLSDSHEEVRQAAISALPQVAIIGDQQLAAAIIERIKAPETTQASSTVVGDANARAAAATVLGRVLGETVGWRGPVEALLGCIRSPSECWLVRRVSIESLVRIVPRGDSEALDALLPCIADEDGGVRQAAVVALGAVAKRGDRDATRALVRMLEPGGEGDTLQERLPFLRLAMVVALGQVAPIGNAAAIKALLARLDDAHAGVRDAATEALKSVSEKGDEAVVEALLDDLLAE